jgi:hypothetical protein
MLRRDPASIECLGSSGDGRAVCSTDSNLLSGVDTFALCGCFGTLAALSSASSLWEECLNPSAVDEVACAHKDGEEEEVEEDAVSRLVWRNGVYKL